MAADQAKGSAPADLWLQAGREHPRDALAARARYLELLRQHGHLVQRQLGDDSPLLPCGYGQMSVAECLPSGCSCRCHRPGGMEVNHVVACCDEPGERR